MKANFPRIHSLSTVGIIYHFNADYLFHPFRTDFTGEGGSGKTMIADMIQLVLLGSSNYRSATEATDERPIQGLVMQAKKGQYGAGYVILNIQKAPGEYIAIGCYIEKASKQARMFIAQAGYDWDGILEPLSKPVYHEKFLVEGKIVSVEDLNKELTDIHLKPLNIAEYHQLLYKNGIINIDLSNKKILQSYGSIFRSFARGKGLKTDSENLKDFLFGDDDKLLLTSYNQQVKSISEDYAEHERFKKEIQQIRQKEGYVKDLVSLERNFKEIEEKYRLDKANFWYQQEIAQIKKHENAQRDFDLQLIKKVIVSKQSAILSLQELQSQVDHYRKSQLNLYELKEKKKLFTDEKENLQIKLIDIHAQLQEIIKVEVLIEESGGIDDFKQKINSECKFEKEKSLLEMFLKYLRDQDISNNFENSLWSQDYEQAKKDHEKDCDRLKKKIIEYQGLTTFSNIHDPNSLAAWAVNNISRPLTHEEESILVRFQILPRERPYIAKSYERYLPFPEDLFNNLDIKDEVIDSQGFWLNLGGVYDYIEYVPQQYLNVETHLIRERLEGLNESVSQDLNNYQVELQKIEQLRNKLFDFEQLKTALQIYPNRIKYQREVDDRYIILPTMLERLLSLKANKAELHEDKLQYESKIEEFIREESSIVLDHLQEKVESCEKYFDNNNIDIGSLDTELFKAEEELVIKEKYYNELEDSLKIINIKEANKIAQEQVNGLNSSTLCNKSLLKINEDYVISINELNKAIVRLDECQKKLNEANVEYLIFFKKPFLNDGEIRSITDPEEGGNASIKEKWQRAKITFEQKYDLIVNDIEDNARLLGGYHVGQLACCLLPSVFKHARDIQSKSVEVLLAEKLDSLEQAIRQIGTRKIEILKKVFTEVQKTYRDYLVKIHEIDRYFKGSNKAITGGSKASLEYSRSLDYPQEWMDTFNKILNREMSHSGIFEQLATETDINEMMVKAFVDSGGTRGAKIEDLLNPKSYFNLEFKLQLDSGERNSGSNSQAYSGYALLGLARLALIGSHDLPGIKIMPIDEAQGLGSNYEMLRQVALEEKYQILSMSIESAGDTRDGEQYIYVLSENRLQDDDNYVPAMAIFTGDEITTDINDFIINIDADS
ncbi:hypothetical protein [Sphingobacterium anhuiense]|uniref:hypothetical protein n=1 Tax=Sphingobacterium anhuiense TaxID=493780 RepID=UPI003C2F69FC